MKFSNPKSFSEQTRPTSVFTPREPATQGLEDSQGFFYVDNPVYCREAPQLDQLQKSMRRLFFVLDSDAYANALADAIGNPPEERHEPETLSHWTSQAVASADLRAARADSTLSLTFF